MKRIISLIIACVFCFVVAGGIFYQIGYENAKTKDAYTKANEEIGQLDYPLIDIPFNDGNEYVIVICNGLHSEEQTYLWCPDGKELQFNKEHIFVRTYPAGRGTTGNGFITVYRNGEEIRYIEFLEIHFADEEIKNNFVKVSSNELKNYLKDK